MASGKYVLTKNSKGQFHWNLLATNGRIVATSEMYESKAAALKGIDSTRRVAADATLVDNSLATAAKAAKKAGAKKAAAKKAGARKAAK